MGQVMRNYLVPFADVTKGETYCNSYKKTSFMLSVKKDDLKMKEPREKKEVETERPKQ